MSALTGLQRVCVFTLAGLSLCVAAPAFAQADKPPAAGGDMAMPDDLGTPLDGVIPTRRRHHDAASTAAAGGVMTLDTPVGAIAGDSRGRAILEKDLPGMLERPEYVMFKGMSLHQLQPMSRGQLTQSDLDKVQADLSSQQIAFAAPRRSHNPLAASGRAVTRVTVASGRAVGRVTQAIYKRVVLVVASL